MLGAFFSFKGLSHSALNYKILHNKGILFSIYDVAGFDRTAHNRAVTPANTRISPVFKKAGRFPFYLTVFTDNDFMIREDTNSNSGKWKAKLKVLVLRSV
jgi:hypothetical protein